MHLVLNYIKKISVILAIICAYDQAHANDRLCTQNLCQEQNELDKKKLVTLTEQTNFVSNAPRSILDMTHHLWQKRMQLCKTKQCLAQQITQRTQELNEFATLNQALTQHFIKYQHGKVAKQQVYLQLHQLEQNKLKIDGYGYSNQQQQHFLAYSQNTDLAQITNNEDGCTYAMTLSKGLLNIQSGEKKCRLFAGNYRRYD
ncbi:A1S_1983 family putative colistin resistance protein [Acinetobacter boissieri]|uniref:Uncharacterized protein n=1 Tax=Acinetobacter boissieri TaxID=1219383 RepID=A0A1G6IEC7_9GAMM|nr:hypothetical protein [Acinetobacter boissieri]SDC04831.1 hypothetical protein SAMN05421733_10888 [Acinetobacter boissieri]